ncbi:hypothetical protein GCM10009841_00930 [Microlunatus panaciterrae]|uniref:Thiamine-binding protein domain-containing protein n=1 Tax=Microlunatus panaciterrae TaxID=400768 RepID=A0ABS2RJJ3_9ACTN|nr:hypothetical protein [Microlunatus panaciterrae]MBM7799175.1 hypothetical protein [Microlunatus panaciterrae]
MPSFRCMIPIFDVRPGHAPEEVMEAALEGIGSVHHLEANGLEIVGAVPVITVRFLVEASTRAEEDALARRAAVVLAESVDVVASHGAVRITRRVKGRWVGIIP